MKMIYANNARFRLNRDGSLIIYPDPNFTMLDLKLVGEMALEFAKKHRIKRPRFVNAWWKIPTLQEVICQ